MKNKLYCILALVVILLSSCQSKLDKNIDKLTEMQKEYTTLCQDGKFDEARTLVENMKSVYDQVIADGIASVQEKKLQSESSKRARELNALVVPYESHWVYVNEHEIYKLLAKPSVDNSRRILYMYNTYEPEYMPNMNDVIDVLISMGDSTTALKLMKSGVEPDSQNAQNAAANDMDEVFELCISKYPCMLAIPDIADYYKNTYGEDKFAQVLGSTGKSLSDLKYETYKVDRDRKVMPKNVKEEQDIRRFYKFKKLY